MFSFIGLYSKVDLVSKMVQEFPELQGVMGGYYAEKKGYDADVVLLLQPTSPFRLVEQVKEAIKSLKKLQ